MRPALPVACLVRLALVAFLFASGAAGAHHLGPEDRNAVHLVLVSHHVYPAEEAGGLGVPSHPDGAQDRFRGVDNTSAPPMLVVDRAATLRGIPLGEGGGARVETATAYRAAYAARISEDAAITLRLDGRLEEDRLEVVLELQADPEAYPEPLLVEAVLVEDDVAHAGSTHRFVVRAPAVAVAMPTPQTNRTLTWDLDASWRTDRLVVAAHASRTPLGEVLQAAAWRTTQVGDTVQAAKAVLFEAYTATDCAPCEVTDAAVDELVERLGLASLDAAKRPTPYLGVLVWWKWALAALGGVAAATVLAPRGPRGPEDRDGV